MRCALLHGFTGHPSVWDDVIAAWQLPEAPVAVALPGHGGTPVADSWDDNLELVSQAIQGCDVAVGYSLGARVALGLVASRRIARAVLISVNPGLDDASRAERRETDAGWARILREQGIVAFEDAWAGQPLFATQARVTEDKLHARRDRRLAHDPAQLARSLEVMGLGEMPDYRADFATLASHLALIVGGDDDKFASLVRALPSVSFEMIANSGHDPTLENPDELAAAIARAVVRLA